jgi:LAO/AO transport system kinase
VPLPREPAPLLDAARTGNRAALARLLSWVEQGGVRARAVGRLAQPLSGGAYTVGITGAPGSGKSTLTSSLLTTVRRDVASIGVLAVDPSSPFSGGAILGDRVRMQDHALDEGVFIRSMATRGHLGGLTLAAPEAIRVLDAVGIPLVVVETVGVGQVEVVIAGSADTTIVVVNPGWGDGVQANKAGLLEIADIFVINKADRPGVEQTRRDLELMLELSNIGDWRPPIVPTVASADDGVDGLWKVIAEHRAHLESSGVLIERRAARQADELRRIVRERFRERTEAVYTSERFEGLVAGVIRRELDPYEAAEQVLDAVT